MSRLPIHHVFPSPEAASGALASDIGDLVSRRTSEGRPAVLGLATGSTPIHLYAELVRLHRQGLSFSNVITFNLDEYLGIGREHPESYWKFMHSHLFEHIDISRENIHIPGRLLRLLRKEDCRIRGH
jgi:glucosamine-6-phosphate deaminase